ncbi:unnamed protein product [Sphenostylis stenocarpa]|uniref:(S)-hydroxynitrile lyase n=1 Tax=Sphenostylis stenocarpa TaxID=92480 RepID=A0AA86SKT3_9FABA|nr:unnamed protein product [Sphenostylis stenocarpa]
MSSENCVERKHFVLVHGACHGAWCWYKLKPGLECAGHKVTVLDLSACGINLKKIEDVDTFLEYTEPLLQLLGTIPHNEKVVLVGHSHGGINIALAMEKFPEKIAVGIFLTAFAPDIQHHPSYVLDKFQEITPSADWLDTKFTPTGNKTLMLFGPKFLSNKLYQLSSVEDLELVKTLARPTSLFTEDLSQQKNFSKEGYGSVPRVFIVCTEDHAIPLDYQLWMIQNAGFNDVLEIKGADHMAMISKPQEVSDSLHQIATKRNPISQYNERTPLSAWMETKFEPSGNKTSMLFGPEILSNKLYQRSPVEDLELDKSLDLAIPLEYQHWMIQNAAFNDVLGINGADHMAMNSKPRELFDSLQKIATKYA